MGVPLNLYYISLSSDVWRRVYLLLNDVFGSDIPDPRKDLDKRDLLIKYGIPVEAWIDLRILEKWFRANIPIPLVSMLGYILSLQRDDGSFSVDNVMPNSGATYRTIELALLLGFHGDRRVMKAVDFLVSSLIDGGLASPGPVEGAVLEVGTTARFMHILTRLVKDKGFEKFEPTIEDMRRFLLSRVYISNDEAAWHTDLDREEIGDIDKCITGATSLALYAMSLLDKPEDGELVSKVCRWLLRQQKDDGGWSDAKGGTSNIDNTFNVVRALTHSQKFLDSQLASKVKESLSKAKTFVDSINPYELRTVSLRAMLLRSRLLIHEDPLHKGIIDAIDALTDMRQNWYSPGRHIYNEILIAGISLAEWVGKLHLCNINPYEIAKGKESKSFKFLFSFPVEIPPFFQGYRDGLGERLLNFLTKLKCNRSFIRFLNESVTIRDIVALIMATFLMLGLFFSEDFIQAIVLPKRNYLVDIYSTVVVSIIYGFWLVLKFRFRNSIPHFFMTTLLALAISYFLIEGWLQFSNELIMDTVKSNKLLPELRLVLVFSLLIDAGRRLINISEIDKMFLSKVGNR